MLIMNLLYMYLTFQLKPIIFVIHSHFYQLECYFNNKMDILFEFLYSIMNINLSSLYNHGSLN